VIRFDTDRVYMIRITVDGVNAVTGRKPTLGEQDYIVLPDQRVVKGHRMGNTEMTQFTCPSHGGALMTSHSLMIEITPHSMLGNFAVLPVFPSRLPVSNSKREFGPNWVSHFSSLAEMAYAQQHQGTHLQSHFDQVFYDDHYSPDGWLGPEKTTVIFLSILNSAGACAKFTRFDEDSVRLIKDVDIQGLVLSPKIIPADDPIDA
jgi:hypothetical protein